MLTLELFGFAAVGLALVFTVAFFVAYRINNYGLVDAAWSYSIGLAGGFYAWAGTGWGPRRLVLGTLAGFWSARLGTHILRRLVRAHPAEDPRYGELRKRWKEGVAAKMFGVFQLQAWLILILTVPLLRSVQDSTPFCRPLEKIGAFLWLFAIVGEGLADHQLATFKNDPDNRGKVCAVGFWRYSRHPNYFFEWLIWVAAFLFGLPSPGGWLGVFAPVAMLVFLAGVTGIPPTERQAVRSKGELYRRYQETTSVFFPWPPHKTGKT